MHELALILSCEHASNAVPARWRGLFAGEEELLHSHRGWDPGALDLGRCFAAASGAILHVGRVTRLLVDLNRSLENRRALLSPWTRKLPADEREQILDAYYHPYRSQVESALEAELGAGRDVLHLSVHSFTPVLHDEPRRADVGLLYDPARERELAFATEWRSKLLALEPGLRVRRNYPYRGTDDGFIPWLRMRHPAQRYVGIELEVNQAWPLGPEADWHRLQQALIETFLAQARSMGLP